MPVRSRLTVADLPALKGVRQLTMLRIFSIDEAAAAQEAGIDIVSAPPELVTDPLYRQVAPSLFTMTGRNSRVMGTATQMLSFAAEMLDADADAVYSSGSLDTIRYLVGEHIPVVGHVGLVPSRASSTGGFRAVGKTADSAWQVYQDCLAHEEAGAIAVEIEVVPVEVATAISRRMKRLSLWSMGSGAGCDAQYLFAMDILGTNRDHIPRHSKVYRNLAEEFDRLQRERIAAFREYCSDVQSGSFPEDRHIIHMPTDERQAFDARMAGE
ncbi:MAG: 3-methyl-2-oxobutanoate hydroxymethyltransferase [Ilumatobacteraceae bacterium]